MKRKLLSIKSEIKIAEDKAKMNKYCTNCGHTLSFFAFEKDTKVCSHCGTMNFRNKKAEFEYQLKKSIIKEKRENNAN